jgi:hypothetical protein
MNSVPHFRLASRASNAPTDLLSARDFQNSVDMTAHFGCFVRPLPSVNHIGKGLWPRRPREHHCIAGATKADTRSNSLHEWLAQEAAMENRHGLKSRAQAA